MKLIKNDIIQQRRFVFDGDNPYEMDKITILLDETTKTCTITDNFGTTYSHTWGGFNGGKGVTFVDFFKNADKDCGYFCNKLGLCPVHLNLKKSKREALNYFFKYINRDTTKDERINVIHSIEEIDCWTKEEFNIMVHNIMDEYSDTWECDFGICEWEGTQKNMRDALKMLAQVIKSEKSKEKIL